MAYKDPNYDPVKAHEYYEKHKKLKGRKKGVTTQQEQLAYVQSQLQKQYKKKNAKARDISSTRASVEREETKMRRDAAKKDCIKAAQEKIDQLKSQYDNATPEQKEAMRKKISDAILNIRESAKAKLGRISDNASAENTKTSKRASNEVKKATEKNKKGYEKALEKAKKKIASGA